MASSTWPHWELQLLHAAGLPTTDANQDWLRLWQLYDRTTCQRNPVNTSVAKAGSSRCKRLSNGKYARNYATRNAAAAAFAQQLNLTDFPSLRKAFLTGDPSSEKSMDGVLLDLQKWGSTRWREQVAVLAGTQIPDSGADVGKQQEANVSGAWTHLHRVLSQEGHATIVELQRSTSALRRIERRLRRA